ncbi:hypothetical protein ACM9HF_05285 [Colwellia sp. RE-S-Sl-9]
MSKQSSINIQVLDGSDSVASELEVELLKSLGEVLLQSNNSSFVLAIKDSMT